MKKSNILFLKAAVIIIGMVILILFIFLLPRLANETAEIYPEFAYLKYPVLYGMYVTGIPFYIALFKAYMLLNIIREGNAFSDNSVIILKGIKKCAISEVILYALLFIYLITQSAMNPPIAIILLAIIFAAFTISVFAGVIQELLKTAIEIKTENDLTV